MKNWNLYTDASVSSSFLQTNDKHAVGWAAILQNTQQPSEEIVLMGAELTDLQVNDVETKAVIAGLRQVQRGDYVRIFADNFGVLGSLIGSLSAEQMVFFLESVQPVSIKNDLFILAHGKQPGLLNDQMRGILKMDKKNRLVLQELKDALQERFVSYTKVTRMKANEGKDKYPLHHRCDLIAGMARIALSTTLKLQKFHVGPPLPYPFSAGNTEEQE